MDDRQLMQQALDALNKALPRLAPYGEQDWLDCKATIISLSERLAHCDRCGKRLGEEGDIHTCTPDPIGDAQDKLIAELAAQPEHEPVTVAIEHCLAARNERTPCPHTVSTPSAVMEDLKWAVNELEALDDATVQFVLDVLRKHLVAGSFTPAQPAPAQQEPVAWPCEIEGADFEQDTVTLKMLTSEYVVRAGKHWLSTTPPAQPALVGLGAKWIAAHGFDKHGVAHWIETSIKEKNT